MNPKVSVIVPAYNASRYLRQCMDSILTQTLKEIEIICVDDGSADSTRDILEEYRHKDSRIKVLSQKNAGAGAARNNGLTVASGEYLSFLDADDFFEPDMLEKAYTKIQSSAAQVLVFRSNQWREDVAKFFECRWTLREKALPPYRPMNYRTFTENVFKVFVGWAWDKLFERTFVEKNHLKFQELRTSNDLLFVFSAIVLADRIEILDDVLAHQRRGNPTSISNTREKSWKNFYDALTALKKMLEEHGKFWELEQDFVNYALHFSLWHLNTLKDPIQTELRNILKELWFRELGIEGKEESYFYDKAEYKSYLNLKN